jgi:hypothetical protein
MGLGMLSAFGQGVVRIPRAGFPYCQPFTSTGNPNDINRTGYVFVDLAFSSVYGIKTSFEYFAHTPASPGNPGDGFSFFLFE